jgi:hypothetical protein
VGRGLAAASAIISLTNRPLDVVSDPDRPAHKNSEAELRGTLLDPARPTARLGRLLYEEMEHLAPGAADFIPWDDLSNDMREIYVLAIDWLIETQGDLLKEALADNDDIFRGAVMVK